MRNFFIWFARSLAILCAVLFVITLFAALLLVSAENRLFTAITYKRAFESSNLYERMPKLLAEQIITNLTANPCADKPLACLPPESTELRACLEEKLTSEAFIELSAGSRAPTPEESDAIQACIDQFGPIPAPEPKDTPGYLKYLTVQDWEILIGTLVPPEQMKVITEQTVNDVFAYLNGDAAEAAVSLTPVKQTLAQNGVQAARRILSAQPDCTDEQLLTLTANLAMGIDLGNQTLCNPPADLTDTLLPLLETSVQAEITTIPDSIPILGPDNRPALAAFQLTRAIIRLSLLLPVILLILMTIFVVRTLKGWLAWWGIPFIFTGVLAVLAALFSTPLTRLTLTSDMIKNSSIYALRFAQAGMDVILSIVRQVMLPVGIIGALLIIIGTGMLVGRQFVPEKLDRDEE
jgi:hypothetical protein